ncbi:MAG: 6-carboxytetrahydropterin synthase QueD [Pseudomonadota bacterium]
MFEIVKSISFCYGHRLLNHQGQCQHLHGHNAKAEIMIASEQLNELGMVMDFADIKAVIKSWIDNNLDHTMLLCRDDPMVPVFEANNERFYLMDDNPTAENIAKLIYQQAQRNNLPVVSVTLWETDTSFARYSEQ